MTDRLGLVDFAVELVSFDLNLRDRQEKFFGNIQMQKNCNQSWCLSKFFWLVKMAIGLVHASYSMTDFLCSGNGFQCWLCQKSAGSWKLCMQCIICLSVIGKPSGIFPLFHSAGLWKAKNAKILEYCSKGSIWVILKVWTTWLIIIKSKLWVKGQTLQIKKTVLWNII